MDRRTTQHAQNVPVNHQAKLSEIHQLKCLCSDCQAYARFLKREKDILDMGKILEYYMLIGCSEAKMNIYKVQLNKNILNENIIDVDVK